MTDTDIIKTSTNITTQTETFNPRGNLKRYLNTISNIPMLEQLEEYELALSWVKKGDKQAAQKLVTSHLRLVAKLASGYRQYGLPHEDIISEGNIGLMQAVKKFNPDKGARLSTYASWWIKATIQEYILKSWSLVKIGTTQAQRKLFFKLRSIKEHIGAYENSDLSNEQLKIISQKLDVPQKEVISMNRRLNKDLSLQNTLQNNDGESEQWQNMLVSKEISPEDKVAQLQEFNMRKKMLRNALNTLNPRELQVLNARRLQEPPLTLEVISKEYSISKERVRQIENKAIEKLQSSMMKNIAIAKPK